MFLRNLSDAINGYLYCENIAVFEYNVLDTLDFYHHLHCSQGFGFNIEEIGRFW